MIMLQDDHFTVTFRVIGVVKNNKGGQSNLSNLLQHYSLHITNLIEWNYLSGINHVDKRIPNIAFVLQELLMSGIAY
jgi:hypothetical protein